MTPTARSLVRLRQLGFVAEPVERWLPRINRKRDLFNVGDVLAVHARDKILLIVQATSLSNTSARIRKAKKSPGLLAWLKAGGLFEVWGWFERNGSWEVKRTAIKGEEMEVEVLTSFS